MLSSLLENVKLIQLKKILNTKNISFAMILFSLYLVTILSIRASIYLPTYHLDGAFQTASGLLRIKWGEIPGIDFFPYLGIGPLLFLMPMFFLFGGDLGASVLTSHFMTLGIMQLISFFTLFFLISSRNKIYAWLFSFIPIFLVYSTGLNSLAYSNFSRYVGLEALFELIAPGNSLRSLRSFAPWLLVIAIYYVHKRIGHRVLGDLLSGFFIGLIFGLWSNDYALLTALVGFVFYIFLTHRSLHSLRKILYLFVSLSFTICTIIAVQLGNGWNESYLKYNFTDVRGDQYWYFAPWSDASRINNVVDLINQLNAERVIVSLIFLFAISFLAFRKKSNELLALSLIGIGLFLGGCVSTIGGHTYNYFSPFKLWGLLIAIALFLFCSLKAMTRWIKVPTKKRWAKSYCNVFTVLLAVFGLLETEQTWSIANEAKLNQAVVWDDRLGGYLPTEYLPKGDFVESNFLIEEYWGLLSTFEKTERNSKTDSVIHALGSQRPQFIKDLNKDDVTVITSSQEIGEWFNWNLSANWWFYRPLFENFDPNFQSPITIKWLRSNQSLKWKKIDCQIASDGQSLMVSSVEEGLYDLAINYEGPGKYSRSFSMIQNNLNYAYGGSGFVALDPGSGFQRFPAILYTNPAQLTLRSINSESKETTRLMGCKAKLMEFPLGSGRYQIVSNLIQKSDSPYNLTDINWNLGVAKFDTGFFVPNTPRNLNKFRVGLKVIFNNKEEREIIRVDNSGPYLNIFLTGEKLSADIHGYPNKFSVVNE